MILSYRSRAQAIYAGIVVLLSTVSPLAWSGSGVLLSAPFISGSSRYSAADLVEAYAQRIGEPVSRSMLDEIGHAIQQRYRRDGYVAPAIVALDSELRSSTPRILVLEAAIEAVAIRGDVGPYFDHIIDRADDLRSGAIETRRVQAFIRKLGELPGLTVRASFVPREESPHRMTLVLDARYEPVNGAVSISNRGTEELGRTVVAGRVTANGLLGSESAASFYGATSDEFERYRFAGASVERSLTGVVARLAYSESHAELGDGYRYDTQRARLELRSRWQLADGLYIEPFMGVTARDADGRYPDVTLSRMRTRLVEVGAAARRIEAKSAAYARLAFGQGLDALGASAFREGGSPADLAFSKVSLDAGYVRTLGSAWRFRAEVEGQWSDANLPAGERFTFGGAAFGRAFDPAELVGDEGAAVSLQIERLQRWRMPWLRQSSVYVQSDYGFTRVDERGAQDAASASVGFKAWLQSALATLELSQHLNGERDISAGKDVRLFAEVQYSF